jgi:hypothetical protein
MALHWSPPVALSKREEQIVRGCKKVTLLQGALGFSDEDAVEYAQFELRWQMLLDCLGHEDAPFAQGTLFAFRQRLIAHDMDRRLLERNGRARAQDPGLQRQGTASSVRRVTVVRRWPRRGYVQSHR